MIFYLFKVINKKWTLSIIDSEDKKLIEFSDTWEIIQYFEIHKDDIWISYGNENKWMLKAALISIDPYKMYRWIDEGHNAWELTSELNRVHINNFDLQINNHTLNKIRAFLGKSVNETSIYDVLTTFSYEVERFKAQLDLINSFGLNLKHMDKSHAKLAAIILKARKTDWSDDFNITLPASARIEKYFHVLEHFKTADISIKQIKINGIEHRIGKGGIHGALSKYRYQINSNELLILLDVDQQYPTIMLKYDLLSRSVPDKNKIRFKQILEQNLKLKAENRHKERKPLKDVCNITYGAMGDKNNNMYDPRNRLLVCIYGQLFTVDLIERLESINSFKLIQSNTDGILIKIDKADFEQLDDIVFEWEGRTGLTISFDYFKQVIQKDVNNYILEGLNGEIKTAGNYVKKIEPLEYELAIVNQAVVENLVNGVPVERTIMNCDNLMDFQRIITFDDKTHRVFATYTGDNLDVYKIQYVPEKCRIIDEDITDMKVGPWLDKKWYIDMAKKRVNGFYDNAG